MSGELDPFFLGVSVANFTISRSFRFFHSRSHPAKLCVLKGSAQCVPWKPCLMGLSATSRVSAAVCWGLYHRVLVVSRDRVPLGTSQWFLCCFAFVSVSCGRKL
ncbi:hypothetical protein Nepgr_019113 [Nepenthes gracilis]|uniref:Uncharacterized protein n=1 Tax=Nepenthes gracilis TaxID=150966 RepID=A0AAD3SUC8_NEPGR|nr:hypothetical protein Nepgr_019113 [Nepenthes gracilis]